MIIRREVHPLLSTLDFPFTLVHKYTITSPFKKYTLMKHIQESRVCYPASVVKGAKFIVE